MKNLFLLFFVAVFALSSCSNVSNKPIFEKLSTEELSKCMKEDKLFAEFYENIRNNVDYASDIEKATYNDITYNRLFNYLKFLRDTSYFDPLSEKWKKEWVSEYGVYLPKADSVLNYWKNYLEENSLNKYVKIELVDIDKEYYSYYNNLLKEVNLGFRLTPLQGTIEQINFNYTYQEKKDEEWYKRPGKHYCISTQPFSTSTIRYDEVDFSDKNKFASYNVETFLIDYNLYIEITDIQKDGVNITTKDFLIPTIVSTCLEYEKNYIFRRYEDDLIKELINENYIIYEDYLHNKYDEICEKKDKLCYDLINHYFKSFYIFICPNNDCN
jgi:hypothetical protein